MIGQWSVCSATNELDELGRTGYLFQCGMTILRSHWLLPVTYFNE